MLWKDGEYMQRKPDWLRVRYTGTPNLEFVEQTLKTLGLNTVCAQANCPNYGDCFSRKTATFMLMGTNCTRNCRFCNVRSGSPERLDPEEPEKVAQAVKSLELKYVVVTSVTRDDLPDGGAGHFANVIRETKNASPGTAIEVLIPDFEGSAYALNMVTDAHPTVISHNMETVEPLYPVVRPQAQYKRSLDVLRNIKTLASDILTKSGLMVGLGESSRQVCELFDDLLEAGCEFITIGQYLAPTRQHIPVHEYIHPSLFEEYGSIARKKGFRHVASAPLVRSSYNARDAIQDYYLSTSR